jgi:hypothetical protein
MKRLVKKSEKEYYAYRGISADYLDKALTEGMYPSGQFGPVIFLAADKFVAEAYGEVVLKVKMNKRNLSEVVTNNKGYYDECCVGYFNETIAPQYNLEPVKYENEIDDRIYDYEDYSQEWEEQIRTQLFDNFYSSAELIVNHIDPDQIIYEKK